MKIYQTKDHQNRQKKALMLKTACFSPFCPVRQSFVTLGSNEGDCKCQQGLPIVLSIWWNIKQQIPRRTHADSFPLFLTPRKYKAMAKFLFSLSKSLWFQSQRLLGSLLGYYFFYVQDLWMGFFGTISEVAQQRTLRINNWKQLSHRAKRSGFYSCQWYRLFVLSWVNYLTCLFLHVVNQDNAS